jgi:hypothetical protein
MRQLAQRADQFRNARQGRVNGSKRRHKLLASDEPCLWGWTLQSKCPNGTAIVIGPSDKAWRGHREHAVAILLNKGSSHERIMLTLSQWLEPA